MQRITQGIIIFLICMQSFALTQQYLVPMETSSWKSTEKPHLSCELSQTIPNFGQATFQQTNTESSQFVMTSWQGVTQDGQANLALKVPTWHHKGQPVKIGNVALQKGKEIIKLEAKLAQRLLLGMQRGLSPTFEYKQDEDHFSIVLSPIDFQNPYEKYLQCVGKLLAYGFNEIENSLAYFDFNVSKLPEATRSQLDRIRDYVLADPSVRVIRIDGYADNLGRRGINFYMSEKRAKAIRDYLVRRGVPKKKIKVNWHGANKPLVDNETEAGRMQNRRVTIELERD